MANSPLGLSTLAVILLAVLSGPVHPSSLRRRAMYSLNSHRRPKNAVDSPLSRIPQLRLRSPPTASIVVSLSENKVLECEAIGRSPPTIHWRKNGKKLLQGTMDTPSSVVTDEDSGEFNQLTALTLTKSRLYLDCVTPADQGVYTCVAENPEHMITSDTMVSVVENVEEDDIPTCLEKKSFGKPARIHMWTHSKFQLIGTDVQFFCRSEGEPRPETRWIGPEDKPLEEEDKFEVLPNGDLIIRNIDWEDRGLYTCISENAYGTDRLTSFLYPTSPEKRH